MREKCFTGVRLCTSKIIILKLLQCAADTVTKLDF